MAWDHGYRADNPVKGIRLKHPPSGPIVVATVPQFQRVYAALPHQPAKVLARGEAIIGPPADRGTRW